MPRPLPVELLFHIVDLALSPDESVSEYGECEKLLTSLCLVSRQLGDFAQPLLFRIFRPELNHLVLLHYPRLAKHVYILSPTEEVKDLGYLAEMIQYLPNLAEVRLRGCKSISKAQLSALCGIEHLSLSNSTTCSFSSVSSATSAASLSTVSAGPGTASGAGTTALEFIEPRGLKKGQLDMLQVHVEQRDIFPGDLLQRGTPVLLTIELQDTMAEHRSSTSNPLPSLAIPVRLFLTRSRACPSSRQSLSTCASRKINIIWRLNSKKPVDDEAVSRNFWRYAKELKRKTATEAKGGGGGKGSA
ncbi:hypothetical protein JCM8547_002643 [Rhodosporidiobolus lusitaniae]